MSSLTHEQTVISIVGVIVAGSNQHHHATDVTVEIAALTAAVLVSVSAAYRASPANYQGPSSHFSSCDDMCFAEAVADWVRSEVQLLGVALLLWLGARATSAAIWVGPGNCNGQWIDSIRFIVTYISVDSHQLAC